MTFAETVIPGTYVVEIEPVRDERGFFARVWCSEEAATRGLASHFPQTSMSFNPRVGTIRGMHYQETPHEEAKLVRCTAGAVYDVAVDLRPKSPTFRRWVAAELTAENHCMLYVPEGVAHGFQTLLADTELCYLISEPYRRELSRGVRWDDPAFAIRWPQPVSIISERDSSFPYFQA